MSRPIILNPEHLQKQLHNEAERQVNMANNDTQASSRLKLVLCDPNFVQLETINKEHIYQIMTEDRQICKAVVEVNAHWQDIIRFVKQGENRLILFKKCGISGINFISGSESKDVQLYTYQLPWPHRNRQFAVQMRTIKSENYCILLWRHIDQQIADESNVGGEIKMQMFIMQKVEQNKSKVTFAIEVDLRQAARMLTRHFLHTHCQSIWHIQKLVQIWKCNQLTQQLIPKTEDTPQK